MRHVTKAEFAPHHCAVYPQLGSAQSEGYFEAESSLPGPGLPIGGQPANVHRIYVSVVAVKDMARRLGWGSPEETAGLRATIERLEAELEEALDRADAAEAVVDSIDVIESAAFRARRKAGKPKQREAVA